MSNDLASLPPAGIPINPSSGAPAAPERRALTEPAASAKDERGFFDRIWGKEGFSFGALIDIINPLQHIPVIGTVYRAITGDTIGPAARIAGGTLFGGAIGLVASSLDTLIKEQTGRDVGQHMLALRDAADAPTDPAAPAGRRERDSVLFAGDFSPRPDAPPMPDAAPATMLAAAPATAQQAAAAVATIPAAAIPAARALPAAATQEAANGAGGRPVPFASAVTPGRHASALPTPQSLAADPAMLRQMQSTRTQGTAIRASLASEAATAPSFLDYMPKTAAARETDTERRQEDKALAKTAPAEATLPPQVPGDLISRMNMALEKYQTMQRVTDRPAVNVSQ
ncbi:MAG: hypothetical protein ACK4NA_13530 [Alphaproteobacteria bacterium]